MVILLSFFIALFIAGNYWSCLNDMRYSREKYHRARYYYRLGISPSTGLPLPQQRVTLVKANYRRDDHVPFT